MKVVCTIFIVLFGFGLSAAVAQSGTPKTHVPGMAAGKLLAAVPTDTVKPLSNSDSVKIIPQVVKGDSTELTATIALNAGAATSENTSPAPVKEEASVFANYFPSDRHVTSLIQLDSLRQVALADQARQYRLRKLIERIEQVKIASLLKINDLDSLKSALKLTTVDTLRGTIYTRIAQKYLEMDNDSVANEKQRVEYEDAVIAYTLKGIHEYSSYADSTGLRVSYTNLSTAYNAERKHVEAKWFILQANTIARYQRDTANIISTLISLAAIKSEIKDYSLAMGDLDQAMQLSVVTHRTQTQLQVLKSYAYLYSVLQNYPKEAMVLKKRDDLLDSIRKAQEAELAKAAALKKRQDTLAKKKLYLASLRKASKNNSQVKVASL